MIQKELSETRIVKVGVLSLANTFAIINLFVGFLFGIFFMFLSLIVSSLLGPYSSLIPSLNLGPLSLIVFSLGYGIMGFISGLLGGLFYNLASKISKGIKLYSN